MANLPAIRTGTKVFAAIAAVVGPAVVEYLKDPERVEQLKQFASKFGPALKAKTPEARLDAKLAALRSQVDQIGPDDEAFAKRDNWAKRLTALETKRTLVLEGLTGRERGKQVKALSTQVDELLLEFLQHADDLIRG